MVFEQSQDLISIVIQPFLARCVDSKRNKDTPKKFWCIGNKWMNKKGTQELNTKNLGCK